MADINILSYDVERDPGLETAILISLFTDRRADTEDVLPDVTNDRRGWWGDTDTDKIGSKFWLLERAKLTPDILAKVNEYAREALQWMKDDGVAKDVIVDAVRTDIQTVILTIQILQPDGQDKFYKYSINWESEILKRG